MPLPSEIPLFPLCSSDFDPILGFATYTSSSATYSWDLLHVCLGGDCVVLIPSSFHKRYACLQWLMQIDNINHHLLLTLSTSQSSSSIALSISCINEFPLLVFFKEQVNVTSMMLSLCLNMTSELFGDSEISEVSEVSEMIGCSDRLWLQL